MNNLLVIAFFIFLDPLLPGNPNNDVDYGSIPTFDEKFSFFGECCCLKKNQNVPRPSEHPPVRKKKCQNV